MKKYGRKFFLGCALTVMLCSSLTRAQMSPALTADAVEPPDPLAWPRQFERNNTTYTMYQPQLEGWDGYTLTGRAAVSVQAKEAKEPTYGVVYLSTDTEIDRDERTVTFLNLSLTHATFPSVPDAFTYLETFRSFLPNLVPGLSLDRFEASLQILNLTTKARSEPLRNEPPAFVFSETPALLVAIEGEPRWAATGVADLERILNTRALLLRDSHGTHYLHLFDGYLSAASLEGPWSVNPSIPSAVLSAQEKFVAAKQVDLLAGQPDPETNKTPTLAGNAVPAIIVATRPTELIVTDGEPKWKPIPGTQLLFVENTPSHLFKQLVDQQTYVLVSGRWFKSPGFKGPWQYEPAKSLPKDFAAIPDDSPQENVKASVLGTRQSQEALIADSIPTTSRITRKTAQPEPIPVVDGAVQVAGIPGTSVSYVVNCATPILTENRARWYACQGGVWFVSGDPRGPWAAATSVPVAFYSLPPSSPLYYVTYVRIYRANDDYVWVGYTPGYYGTVIGPDGVVIYGTGYAYVPYVSTTVYVSYPSTYGYGTNACWTPWAGWAFAFAAGWAWGAHWNYWACVPPAPFWGPYWSHCYGVRYNAAGGITAWGPYGWAGTSGNIYAHAGAWSSVSRVSGGFDAWSGNRWTSQYGHAYNSVTGTSVAGRRGAVGNVYTGDYAFGSRGVAHNDRTGITTAGSHFTAGNAYTGNEVSGGRGVAYNPNTGNAVSYAGVHGDDGGIARVGDHVVAGHDGNVYTRNDNGSWSPAGGLGASSGSERSFDRGSLDREFDARQLGAQRTRSFNASRGGFRH